MAPSNPSEPEIEPQDVTATMKFLSWQPLYETEKPFQIFMNIPPDVPDQRTTNLVFEDHQVKIQDIRKLKEPSSIDEKGFIYRKHKTAVTDFTSRKVVEEQYLPEVEELLKSELDGVDKVFFFDWRLRKNAPEIEGEVINMNDLTTWLRPAMHVHIDQSPSAVLRRIQLQLPDEAEFLLQGRVRVVNVWRPLIPSILDYPLSLCSGSPLSVSPSSLVECDHIRRHYMGSTMYLQYEEGQEFWYMSRQGLEDVVVFKNFDSEAEEGGASFAPHASFRHPSSKEEDDVQRRESIEVRALVFTYAPTAQEEDGNNNRS